MVDIKLIREDAKSVIQRYKDKEIDCAAQVERILELDKTRRELISESDALKAEQNKASKEIPAIKKQGGDASGLFARMKEIAAEGKEIDARLAAVSEEYSNILLSLPNLPDPDLKPGGKENNEPISYFGEPKRFDFEPKNHVDICTDLGLVDYTRAAKLSGSGFVIYRGMGARLEWALLNYFIDTHTADGYEFILPPHMLGYEAGLCAGQFPKFESDVFWVDTAPGEPRKFMLPTAETALAGIFAGEIFIEEELPMKMFAYTPCFRREAGSYRSDERGMIRGHQFNKVEMFQFVKPEDSDAAFEELLTKAENLVKGLGFHFRTVKLAAGDCSASMARTYDLEIHIPSMNGYKEISSVSNARDYQARRASVRYKSKESGKTEFIHTLNGSGLATSRILPASVEQNQLPDGSVKIPPALVKYLGVEVIKK